MPTTRRQFLRYSGLTAASYVIGRAAYGQPPPATQPGTQPAAVGTGLKILILGGTGFLGPAVVEAARPRGHTLTLFNRGKTRPNLFPDLEKLHGDRDPDKDEGLKALEGRKWDAVVDTSAYVPRIARASAELLKDSVKHYTFISTCSVYADNSKPGMDETAAVGKVEDEKDEKVTETSYGPLKALCEQAVEKAMPGRVATIRPGLIVGPGDPSDRFTYWPVRVARGGEVLAPGSPDDPVQIIDVRDLGEWIVHVIEKNVTGVFNALGPDKPLTIGGLLESCKRTSGSDAKFTWADADFLAAHEVSPWGDMPVWVPPRGEEAGFSRQSNARAVAKGLKFRPVDATCKDTLEWFRTLPEERQAKLRAGIQPEREKEVLAAWHAKQG
jgi:2'-hydroxyisoflavone reductase